MAEHTIYRTLTRLSFGENIVEKNRLIRATAFSPHAEKKLVEMRKITPVNPPPLDSLKGWTTRAGKLARTGIITLADFILADELLIMEVCRVDDRKVEKWKAEFRGLLGIHPDPKG